MWMVEPARAHDLPALLHLARMTGSGFTNLPDDADELQARLDWSCESFARAEGPPDNELYILVLRDSDSGDIGGTGMVFSRVGAEWPFYSYKLSQMSQASRELDRVVPLSLLNLVTDHDGASEVGGLFLHPDRRAGGLGKLLARSRYLFIAQHRARFAERMIAELRGVSDEAGNSPFWDAIGRKFFGMSFPQADAFNAKHGSQFIADLMPRQPIYTALLPDDAQAVIGQPHPKGRGALAMLEREGFVQDNYLDIFDGGPTVVARTDQIETVRAAQRGRLSGVDLDAGAAALVAAGLLTDFRAFLSPLNASATRLPGDVAAAARLGVGDEILHVWL